MTQLLTSISVLLSGIVAAWSAATNPENRKLKDLHELDKAYDVLIKERDICLAKIKNSPNDDDFINLGIITNKLLFLRKKRRTLERH